MHQRSLTVPSVAWLVIIALLAFPCFLPRWGQRFFLPCEAALRRLATRRTLVVVLIFLAAILLRISLLPLIPVPQPGIHDEFSNLLAADTFAHGRLTNPPHPLWLSFETFHVLMFPTYCSKYPPAQGMILALGQLLGHPWIGVLLSCAALCAAITWMLQAWLPARWALLGGLIALLKFALISYWMNSYWGGAAPAIGGALLLGGLGRIFRKPRASDALLLGLGLAILANSRPYEGLVLSVPAAVAFLLWLKRPAALPWSIKLRRIVLPLAACLALTAAFIAYYNWRLTGDALLMPHVLDKHTYRSTGEFLWDPIKPPLHYHNPQFEAGYNVFYRNIFHRTWKEFGHILGEKYTNFREVYLWPGADLLFLLLPLLFRDRRMRLLLWELAAMAVAISAVTWSLPHYLAPATGLIYALLVQCIRHLRTLRFSGRPVGLGLSRMFLVILALTVGTGLYLRVTDSAPWLWDAEMGISRRASVSEKLRRLPGNHLVIVRYGPLHDFNEEWVYNAADIDHSKIVWAREMDDEQNQKLLAYFHDRRVWLVQPDDDTSDDFEPYSPE
ncbi:MAG: hypothetical protein LAN71_04695 [Acidobacteriia bacterium]|nr:hypothetical protein [Terriglobia bacterium]